MYALCGILSHFREDRWRFSSIISCGLPRPIYTLYMGPWVHVVTLDVSSCAFTKLMFAIYGIFYRRLDARCRFVSIVSYGVSMLLLAWFGIEVGVATVGVATLSASVRCRVVGNPEAYLLYIYGIFRRRRVNRRHHTQHRFVSVVSCGIHILICAKDGILCGRRNAYRRGSRRGFVCVMSYVIPRITYFLIRKNIPKPKILTKTQTQDSFRLCDLSSCNLLSETNKFCLGAVFSCA
jgi:hypothetical protein